jgi:hypothetical protein
MNEERTGRCLRQVEHIRGHLWHRYSRMVNKVMVETAKFSKWWFQRTPLSRRFSRVRVTWSLVLCVCFIDHCLSFCPFSFGHCIVCSLIYSFWLPLWFLQTFLASIFSFLCSVLRSCKSKGRQYSDQKKKDKQWSIKHYTEN